MSPPQKKSAWFWPNSSTLPPRNCLVFNRHGAYLASNFLWLAYVSIMFHPFVAFACPFWILDLDLIVSLLRRIKSSKVSLQVGHHGIAGLSGTVGGGTWGNTAREVWSTWWTGGWDDMTFRYTQRNQVVLEFWPWESAPWRRQGDAIKAICQRFEVVKGEHCTVCYGRHKVHPSSAGYATSTLANIQAVSFMTKLGTSHMRVEFLTHMIEKQSVTV